MTVAELRPGEKGIVSRVEGEGALRLRLLDMGLTPGTAVVFLQAAPLGDPILLSVRGYLLSLRRADAEKIFLEGRRL